MNQSHLNQPPPSFSRGEAIIQPMAEPGDQPVAARVIMTFARPDYHFLSRLIQAQKPRYIWDCAIREGIWNHRPITLAAPAVGAPYAAMILEKLIALGGRIILALGWCGSLQPRVRIGDLTLPDAAVSGDGASRHYAPEGQKLRPDPGLQELLRRCLAAGDLSWHEGPVWTTDAFYRETPALVRHYQDQGVMGVDLELAALFAVGQFRRIPVAALLAVSDELATLTWRPGYRSARFRQTRDLAARLVLDAAASWEEDHV